VKRLDVTKTIYELCREDPRIADVMREAGFTAIAGPGMLNTVGRVMTIPLGAKMRGLNLQDVLDTFRKHGYEIHGLPDGE
jgi:hypothetical protein